MKRNFLSILLIFVFAFGFFAGCGKQENPNTDFKVTFYVNGEAYHSLRSTGNKKLILPTNPTRTGYSFEGWFFDENTWIDKLTEDTFVSKPITKDINVYAKFRQNRINYNINFYANGNLHATIKTAGNEMLTAPSNPTKKNYTFEGWYFDEDFTKPFTTDAYANKKLAADISVYAKFAHIDGTVYKITFMVEDEYYSALETAGNTALAQIPPDPKHENEDYIFVGWFFDKGTWKEEFDAFTYSTKYLTDNVTVYARYMVPEPEKFLINFMVGDTIYYTIETSGHETLSMPENPEKEGYNFVEWYEIIDVSKENDDTMEVVFDSTSLEMISLLEDKTVYARFEEKEIVPNEGHIISFMVDGQPYDTVKTAGNDTIKLPTNPEKEEYTFAGWFFDDETFLNELTADYYTNLELTEDVMVYAQFTPTVYESNLEFVLSEDETYYIVVGLGECTAKNILIPDTYNELPVKELVGVTYDEHYVKVYDGAFYMTDIERVKISANIEVIGRWCFGNSDKLTTVEFAEGSKLHTIHDLAFNRCFALRSINLPKGVTKLPEYAFAQCESLTSFTFEDFTEFTEFGPYALYGTGITTIDIPKNLVKIGEHCFAQCASLARISLPKSLKTIDTGAFNDCRKLKYVEIEDTDAWCGVDIADPWAVPFNWADGFYQNGERVTNLVISEGVKKIKKFVFADCTLLESITIPSTVELMESCAFADVLRLKVLNYNAKNCKLKFYSSSSHYYIFEHCGAYSLTAQAPGYKYPDGAKHITVNIGATVQTLPANLFGYASGGFQPLVKTINFLGTTPPEMEDKWIKAVSLLEDVNVPQGKEQTYLAKLGSYYEKFLLPEETE